MSESRDAPAPPAGAPTPHEDAGAETPAPAVVDRAPSPPFRSLARKLLYLFLDLLGAAGWTWMAIALPLPVVSEYLTIKNTLVVFVTICWVGRAIVDTFFYNRHP